jgi:RND family efflux transporter MFP subunit
MKGKKGIISLLFILSWGVALVSWAQAPPPSPVVVSPVVQRQVRESVVLVGTATSRVTSLLASAIEGLVEELYVNEGDSVKEGKVLAKLRSSTLKIQLELARAARREAEERYLRAKAELERSIRLRRSESISEKKFLDDRSEAMAWEQRVRQRDAEISRLEDLLAKKTIIAPFSGLVAKKHTEVGQWLEKGGDVLTLIDIERIHVVVPVPERYVDKIRVGDRASVSVNALGNRRYSGIRKGRRHHSRRRPGNPNLPRQGGDQEQKFPHEKRNAFPCNLPLGKTLLCHARSQRCPGHH